MALDKVSYSVYVDEKGTLSTGTVDFYIDQIATVEEYVLSGVYVDNTGASVVDSGAAALDVCKVTLTDGIVYLVEETATAFKAAVDAADTPEEIALSGTVSVDNFPASQDVVVTSSALPDGAATEATLGSVLSAVDGVESKLDTANSSLSSILGAVDGVESKLDAANTSLDNIEAYTLAMNNTLPTKTKNFVELTALTALSSSPASGEIIESILIVPTNSLFQGDVSLKDGSGAAFVIYKGSNNMLPVAITGLKATSQLGGYSLAVGDNLQVIVTGKWA